MAFVVNSNSTLDRVLSDSELFNETLNEWINSKRGFFVNSAASTMGYLRLPNDSPILSKFEDPSSGPLSGHIELTFAVSISLTLCSAFELNPTIQVGTAGANTSQFPDSHFMSVGVVTASPASRELPS